MNSAFPFLLCMKRNKFPENGCCQARKSEKVILSSSEEWNLINQLIQWDDTDPRVIHRLLVETWSDLAQ